MTKTTVTAAARAEINAWINDVRTMAAAYGRPIHDGDPRLELMAPDLANITDLSPEERGDLYFMFSHPDLPAWPLPTPAWATETQILIGVYPEVIVEHRGKAWAAGRAGARVQQSQTVFVEDWVNHDGSIDHAGDFYRDEPRVVVTSHEDELTWEDALDLSEVLRAAGNEL